MPIYTSPLQTLCVLVTRMLLCVAQQKLRGLMLFVSVPGGTGGELQ